MAHLVTNYIISDFLDLFELKIGTDSDFWKFYTIFNKGTFYGRTDFQKKKLWDPRNSQIISNDTDFHKKYKFRKN